MFRELDESNSLFDLPRAKFFTGDPLHDFRVRFHDHVAGCPLGPAAGPQSQMAQNLVLSWLGGCRVFELKTVQILDELEIPRPCIDAQTVGYNVEWSQELKLEESLLEYVKGAMLIEILRASGKVDSTPGFEPLVFDMSVGYDLAGIQTERVEAFIEGMKDASGPIETLRAEIPSEFAEFRDLDFDPHLADTLTLSTFHGCPPDEIERIVDFLLERHRLHCVVKLNPTLLGPTLARELLHDQMGYDELTIPDTAFANDTTWPQMEEFVERLRAKATSLGLGFGVKFSNTQIVQNHRQFFPDTESEMYLSGQPLHVLAMNLVAKFRDRFGDELPISFSAGIDRTNFADAAALGLVPITVCTDLLRPGGYARQVTYLRELGRRMKAVQAHDLDDWIRLAFGNEEEALARAGGDPSSEEGRGALASLRAEPGAAAVEGVSDEFKRRWVSEARLLNTRSYVRQLATDSRYHRSQNEKVPKKIGSHLELFDCITCDKCIPVCPNDANFRIEIPPMEIPIVKVDGGDGQWTAREDGTLALTERHQIGNFADFCNDCGNCDVFCPEDGGPYVVKPRFFGTRESFDADAPSDGFCIEAESSGWNVAGRFRGALYEASFVPTRGVTYVGPEFRVVLARPDSSKVLEGEAKTEVDLTFLRILEIVARHVVLGAPNYVNASHAERLDPFA